MTNNEFNRENLDHYLYLLAKEYKKMNKNDPECEIILVGGSSVMLNYNFRNSTTDVDSIIRASSNMKEVINKITDEEGLQNGWINDDFKKTASYSDKLVGCSKFYKKFCKCLEVRTIRGEYLVAMKIKSFRLYKNDISDIIGILKDSIEFGYPLLYEDVDSAYRELYNESIPGKVADVIKNIFNEEDLEGLYYEISSLERKNKDELLKIQDKDNTVSGNGIDIVVNDLESNTLQNIKKIAMDLGYKNNSEKIAAKVYKKYGLEFFDMDDKENILKKIDSKINRDLER